MKKVLIIVVACICVFVGVIFSLKQGENAAVKLTSDGCQLNLQDCEIPYNGALIKASFFPKPVRAMAPTTLKLSGLNGDFKHLNAVIKGVNMNMGVIKSDFVLKGSVFETNVVFNSCVNDMLYEIEIFDEDKPLGLSMQLIIAVQ